MINFTALLEFSHTYCVAICAVLVPLNLIATLQTLFLVGLKRSPRQVRMAIGLASLVALVMVFHVLTWFVIGVVMVQTYVLLSLGGVCLSVNLWAAVHPRSMSWVLTQFGRRIPVQRLFASFRALQVRIASSF